MINNRLSHIHPPVFVSSVILLAIFITLTLHNLEQAKEAFTATRLWIANNIGWLFIFAVQVFLIYPIYLALSKYGDVRLGGTESKPQYHYFTWICMMFSAGLGIGLVFWGVAEPIYHFDSPPMGEEGRTPAAAQMAMSITFMHWGLHAWGIYALVGLALGFFVYNQGMPFTIRSCLSPIFGEKTSGWPGDIIDTLAVLATLFGVATSLGLGAAQIASGLNYLFGLTNNTTLQIVVIIVITLLATWSVATGLDKGIKYLSQTNVALAVCLLVFVLLTGPLLFLLKGLMEYTGHYLQNLMTLSTWNQTYFPDSTWQSTWTIFYWAWWIAWSPFVGTFLARISYGRSIREFVVGALLVPTGLSIIWLSVFGGTALWDAMFTDIGIVAAVKADLSTSLFVLLEGLPLSAVTSVAALLVIVMFFVTSSDSASLVIDTIAAGGRVDAPARYRIFWALMQGTVAIILLLGGGLMALQSAAVALGFPFVIVLLLVCIGLSKGLQEEKL